MGCSPDIRYFKLASAVISRMGVVQPVVVARSFRFYRMGCIMSGYNRVVRFRHWLPLITVCPVNNLPDLLYVTVEFNDSGLTDLYRVRARIRKIVQFKRAYMEDLADKLLDEFPGATITVSLAFARHVVIVSRLPQ